MHLTAIIAAAIRRREYSAPQTP